MIEKRLSCLRKEMEREGVDAYLITGFDPHQSEYVASRWRDREFISGFTGSAGTVIVTRDKALLWVDSRYFIQGAAQTEGTEFILMKLDTENTPNPEAYMEAMDKGTRIGVSSSSVSISSFLDLSRKLGKKGIELAALPDLVDRIWEGRPAVPSSSLEAMPVEYAGLTASEKLAKIRKKLADNGLKWTFIASIDDIAWTTNLRGDDILYNPVFMSYLFVSLDKAVLFTSLSRFSDGLLAEVRKDFEVLAYEDAGKTLPELIDGPGYYCPEKVNYSFYPSLSGEENEKGRDITTDLKAEKNIVEMAGMRKAHLYDGIAFARFMASLDPDGEYTEIEISDRFEAERAKMPGYRGPSFAPISGFREHGAMCHYSATPESNMKIDGHGLLVLDTGSQFEFGMTDLTRTLLFGSEDPTDEEKRDYTLVLKGHLAIAHQRFLAGTRGVQLDVLAKQYLWQSGMSFFHGTGHGVGCRLNVHEGPMNISSRMIDVALRPGMVVSDEPGLYKEGRHGIRIENLVAVQEDARTEFGQFYSFEVLSLVPYEKRLIDARYLSDEEIAMIDSYHEWIYKELEGYLDEKDRKWLRGATSPLGNK